jgi:Cytochrome c, mono- and diheme variants
MSPTIEAENYENQEMFAPLQVRSEGQRTYIVAEGDRNDAQTDVTPGQAHYKITASDTTIRLYAVLNLRDELTDSFFIKVEGLSDTWAMENGRTTNGFQELLLGTWTNSQPGQTYTIKILRRETGVMIDSLRVEGAMFGATPAPSNPFVEGKALYEQHCATCHGINGDGQGALFEGLIGCNFCNNTTQLASKIETTMPPQDPTICGTDCAAAVAFYVMEQFNAPELAEEIEPSKARAWLLSASEYRATLAQLLGLPSSFNWLEGYTDISDDHYYPTASDHLQVSQDIALYFIEQSEAAVGGLSEAQITSISPCPLNQATCLTDFTRNFAQRAFRKDLTNAEADRYLVFADGLTGVDRYRQVMIGILNSPYFLYRTEMGNNENVAEGDTLQLTGFEVASMISYALTGEPPKDDLLQAARRGDLNSVNSLRLVVNQMIADPKVSQRLHTFIRNWLQVDEGKWAGVEHSDAACENFAEAKSAIENEFKIFLQENATINDGLEGLFNAPLPEPTGALREFYASINDPAGLGPLRHGMFSSGIFAARHAQFSIPSPVMRGAFMRTRILCQELPEPPGVVPDLGSPGQTPNVITNRDVYEVHLVDSDCKSCHVLMDPLGFTMENFDACGRYRTIDNGGDVDATGEIIATSFDTPVGGLAELSSIFSEQQVVRECFASNAYQFYLGATKNDVPKPLTKLIADNLSVNDSFREVLVQLLTNESILIRKR